MTDQDGWETLELDDGAHVIPLHDQVDHEPTRDCVCGPQVTPTNHPAMPDTWLVQHRALDGREDHDRDRHHPW